MADYKPVINPADKRVITREWRLVKRKKAKYDETIKKICGHMAHETDPIFQTVLDIFKRADPEKYNANRLQYLVMCRKRALMRDELISTEDFMRSVLSAPITTPRDRPELHVVASESSNQRNKKEEEEIETEPDR